MKTTNLHTRDWAGTHLVPGHWDGCRSCVSHIGSGRFSLSHFSMGYMEEYWGVIFGNGHMDSTRREVVIGIRLRLSSSDSVSAVHGTGVQMGYLSVFIVMYISVVGAGV